MNTIVGHKGNINVILTPGNILVLISSCISAYAGEIQSINLWLVGLIFLLVGLSLDGAHVYYTYH